MDQCLDSWYNHTDWPDSQSYCNITRMNVNGTLNTNFTMHGKSFVIGLAPFDPLCDDPHTLQCVEEPCNSVQIVWPARGHIDSVATVASWFHSVGVHQASQLLLLEGAAAAHHKSIHIQLIQPPPAVHCKCCWWIGLESWMVYYHMLHIIRITKQSNASLHIMYKQ